MKQCRICREELPLAALKRRAGLNSPLRNECRQCANLQRNPRTRPAPARDQPFMGWKKTA